MASPTSVFGPFRPGAGRIPPYLAGRESEKRLFTGLVADLAAKTLPASDVILHGPRGNGKTTLLLWIHQRVGETPGVDSLRLTPSRIRTAADLGRALLAPSWLNRLTPKEIELGGLHWRSEERPPESWPEILSSRVRTRPLVLLLDEAHRLDPGLGESLLNEAQAIGGELPLLFVLAGTPDLEDRLGAMGASFWNRARRISVSRLDAEAAADAIRIPLESGGVGIEPEALSRILAASHGYPFFLQVWGELVWARVAEASPWVVTVETVEAARPDFDRRRGVYYLSRYEEFEKGGLLATAATVATAFATRDLLSGAQLRGIVQESLAAGAPGVEEALTALRHLGFTWRPGPEPFWEPGIPSLMDYIRKYAPAP